MRRAFLALGFAFASLAAHAAAAEDATREGVDVKMPARVVEIRVAGDAAALAKVSITARELLLRLDVTPVVKALDEPPTPATEPVPLVIAYVDLLRVAAPSIDIEDGETHEELTRRNLSDVSSLETGVEAVLHVLYLAVESKLQVGLLPPRAPAPVSTPVATKKPVPPVAPGPDRGRSRFGLDVGPLLRLTSLGDGRFVPGGGLGLEPRVDFGRAQAGLMVTAALHGASELKFQRGSADVRPFQVRVAPTFDWLLARDMSAVSGLGAGLDSFLVAPGQAPDAGQAAPAQTAWDPVLTALLGIRMPISGRAFLAALATLDFDVAPTSFVAQRGLTSEPLLTLPRLRGGFTLALDFTVAGERRFSKAAREP